MSQITVEKPAEDSASKSLRVTVPVDRVQEAEIKALHYYVQRARLPGFRPGKAPEGVVRKRFADAIRQSVLEEVIRESWETAKSSESLKPIADPEERIMTLLPGETTDAEVRFPEDHPDERRRGQTRRVRVTLHDVKRQELPPLDDGFAREVGDFENLEALRAAVRHDLEHE